ncbi:MAG: sugar phosphate isomerase/epimerase family protein [Nitrososphaerales archaeon]
MAFSTNAFVKYSLESAISKIAECGYDAVEILADKPHAFFPISKKQQLRIIDLLRNHKIAVSNVNANTAYGFFDDGVHEDPFEPSLASSDEKRRRWRINYTKQAIDFASLIDARNISITSGKPVSGYAREERMERFLESLRELVKYASVKKIGIGLEYEPGLLIENANQTSSIIKEVNSEYLGVNLDIGHCQLIGEHIPQIIEIFSGRIFNIHLYDINGRRHYHLIPGKGAVDFLSVFESLRNVRYNRYVTVELYTFANKPLYAAHKALDHLRKVQG